MSAANDRRSNRDASLDLARALAVVAMVCGHSLDAFLATDVRTSPGVATYWSFRGLTAPLFLVVSGWAVSTVLSRSPLRGLPLVRRRLPRVLLLLALGYGLRLPLWGLERLRAGDPAVLRHALAFDALHAVAIGVLGGTLAFACARGRTARLALMLVLAAGIPLVATPVTALLAGAPLLVAQTLAGGDAPFPVFPWTGYFFAGALLGLLPLRALAPLRRAFALALAGGALVALALVLGIDDLEFTSPVLFAWRLGQIVVLAALVALVPARVAGALAPLGRSSLGVYVFHVPLLYGWGVWQGLGALVGPTLSLGAGLALALALLAGGLLASELGDRALRLAARLRPPRLLGVPGPAGPA
jgi:peptidoglycan/LPS O-acetylase OafA/YrhL